MTAFIISAKLTVAEALEAMRGIEKWFRDNPKRLVCQTDIFKVRRSFYVEDILEHTDYSSPTTKDKDANTKEV